MATTQRDPESTPPAMVPLSRPASRAVAVAVMLLLAACGGASGSDRSSGGDPDETADSGSDSAADAAPGADAEVEPDAVAGDALEADDASPPALGPDIDGVAWREVGLTPTVLSPSGDANGGLDVNGDGVTDFELELSRNASPTDTDRYAALSASVEGNEVLLADVPNAGGDGGMFEAARVLALGERVEGSSTRWGIGTVLHEFEAFVDEVEDDYGLAGDGRVLLGVRFITGTSDLLYGWLEVSADAELTTVTVHSAGWAELPEVGVGAGDR